MNFLFWILLIVIMLAIFGGAFIAGAAWLAWFGAIGIVIGALARLLVPDSGGFGLPATILGGLTGALIGGAVAHVAELGWFIEFLVSVLAAAVVIALANGTRGSGSRART